MPEPPACFQTDQSFEAQILDADFLRMNHLNHRSCHSLLLAETLLMLLCRNSAWLVSAGQIEEPALAAAFAQIQALLPEMLAAGQLVDKSAENCFARPVFQLETAGSVSRKCSDAFHAERFRRYQKQQMPPACLSANCSAWQAVSVRQAVPVVLNVLY